MDSTASATTSTSAAAAAADDGGGVTLITALHPDIIRSHILNRLDGPTLASAGCASAQLLADDHLWKEICNTTWPSTAHSAVRRAISGFPSGHRSFFSDSFTTVRYDFRRLDSQSVKSKSAPPISTPELISAVDIFYEDQLLYSKVLTTDARSSSFANTPFRVDLLDSNETVATPLRFDGEGGACAELAKERLRVSWIVIDPYKNRAINVASGSAVESRRHWLTEGIQLRFATVAVGEGGNPVQVAVTVACGGKDGGDLGLTEVSMQAEDMEGRVLTGRGSLAILRGAMEGQRCKSSRRLEKDIYERFLRRRVEVKERRERREKYVDTCCIVIGVSIFYLAIWMFFLQR